MTDCATSLSMTTRGFNHRAPDHVTARLNLSNPRKQFLRSLVARLRNHLRQRGELLSIHFVNVVVVDPDGTGAEQRDQIADVPAHRF
jgi:hypothetical protein